MTKKSWFDHMTAEEQESYENWMDELDAEYLEEAFISDRAEEEAERNFDYFGEF